MVSLALGCTEDVAFKLYYELLRLSHTIRNYQFQFYLHLWPPCNNSEWFRWERQSEEERCLDNISMYPQRQNHYICKISNSMKSLDTQSWCSPSAFRKVCFAYNRYQSWLIACRTGCVFISTWSKRFVANWKLHFHETGPLIIVIGKSSSSGICSKPKHFRFAENLP